MLKPSDFIKYWGFNLKIAVCLAAYNGEKWIASQLSSIIGQLGVDVTIYVSIDRSTDNTLLIVTDFAKKYNNIVIISSELKFGSASSNFFHLINNVPLDFDYYALCDQDDIWLPDKLISACNEIFKQSAYAYSSDVIAYWPYSKKFKYIKKSYPMAEFDHYFESAGPGCTYVLTRSLVYDLREFLTSSCFELNKIGSGQHDWFIYFFARKFGYKWIIHDSAKILYRQHSNNLFGVNSGFLSIMKRLSLISSGWFFSQSLEFSKMIRQNNDDIFKFLDKKNKLHLVLNFYKFRRSLRDKFFILMAIILFF